MRALLAAAALCLAVLPARAGLLAAAGKVDITPDLSRKVYLAGYGASGRPAAGIHDSLYARALVVSDGRRTVALVGVDLLGFYADDVNDVRRELGWVDGGANYLFIGASHTHSGPDTLGLWGRFPGVSGVDPVYQAAVRGKIAGLVRDLQARLEPAAMAAGERVQDPHGLCSDKRDPIIINPFLTAARFKSAKGKTLGTLVNWSCHPEAVGSANRELTSDLAGVLCKELDEDGGTCVFLNGTIGGMLTPEKMLASDTVQAMYDAARRIGKALAASTRETLKGRPYSNPSGLEFSSVTLRVPIENARYLAFLPALRRGHRIYAEDGRELGRPGILWQEAKHFLFNPRRGFPLVETEVSHVRIGPVEILGIPGEIFPELVVGGYDGRWSFGRPVVRPDTYIKPDISQAPRGPYLRDLMKGPLRMVVGLANDELGYIIPAYDFKYSPTRTMLPEPRGHYEETNSIGQSATGLILAAARRLLGVQP